MQGSERNVFMFMDDALKIFTTLAWGIFSFLNRLNGSLATLKTEGFIGNKNITF